MGGAIVLLTRGMGKPTYGVLLSSRPDEVSERLVQR